MAFLPSGGVDVAKFEVLPEELIAPTELLGARARLPTCAAMMVYTRNPRPLLRPYETQREALGGSIGRAFDGSPKSSLGLYVYILIIPVSTSISIPVLLIEVYQYLYLCNICVLFGKGSVLCPTTDWGSHRCAYRDVEGLEFGRRAARHGQLLMQEGVTFTCKYE